MPDQTYQGLRAALAGDADARGSLLERLRPRLVLWSSTRMSPSLRSKLEPEDAAQEILLVLHRSLDQFKGGDERAFRAWLFTVAENRIRDLAEHAGALKRKPPLPMSFSQTSPSQAAIRTEMAGRMRRALEGLNEDYRRVIQLRRLEERDPAEVAEILNRTPNAARVLYCRAIQALREQMREEN
ncbi:MAG: RNA polymerase sigma factor [Planctomycetota bacterium]